MPVQPKAHDGTHDGRISSLEATVATLVEGWNNFRKRSEIVEGKIFDKLDDLAKNLSGVRAGAGRLGLSELWIVIGICVAGSSFIATYVNLRLEITEKTLRLEQMNTRFEDYKLLNPPRPTADRAP